MNIDLKGTQQPAVAVGYLGLGIVDIVSLEMKHWMQIEIENWNPTAQVLLNSVSVNRLVLRSFFSEEEEEEVEINFESLKIDPW